MARTVKSPSKFEAIFDKAEERLVRYFRERRDDPTKGIIEISNERFFLVRGAALSIEFFDILKNIFSHSEDEAARIANQVLFDVAHALGKADAKHFHKSMGLVDPISRLSAGPVLFAHTGWAFVDISGESKPEPNENYFLLYDHPNSFEADAWIRAGRESNFPVCTMNSGYSSGWCEESFGIPLTATEISCRCMGDERCRFIMAPPDRIETYLARYLGNAPARTERISAAAIGKAFDRDWTRERLLEKTLGVCEQDYRSLFETSPDAITVWNKDDIIEAANASAASLFGYDRADDLKGKNWQTFVAPEDLQTCVDIIRRLEKSRGIAEAEFRMRQRNGNEVFVQSRVFLDVDGNGRPSRAIAITRDITELKRTEAELRRRRAHLEEMVAARTAGLAEANAKLEYANNELEAFAYSVSHDLRAPLRAIEGFTNVLQRDYADKLGDEGRRVFNVVCESTAKMGQMIQDILALSRAGRGEMTTSLIDMKALVDETIKELESVVAGRKVRFVIGRLPEAQGDARLIRHVWTNLLDNAVKFTSLKPEAIIQIGAIAEDNETVYYVRDNGAGFDMKYADKLFGVFQRFHGARFVGNGIGLAIVKRVVTRHGGRVWAEGKPDEGAVFYFALPKKGDGHV